MSRAVVVADVLRGHARTLKMPGLMRSFEATARQAREDGWSHEEYLQELLATELQSRNDSAVRHRLRDAKFPETKALDEFDFDATDGIDRALVAQLAGCDWIDRAENLLLAGPIGTGKTHLAIALGIEACRQRRRVAFWRAADLVRVLIEARDTRLVGKLQRRLDRVELLIVDEVGFVPFGRDGGELLFNVLATRYEQRSVLVTTNLAFAEWPKVFGDDEKLTTALLDRLAHHATVITPRGKSYRMRRRAKTGKAAEGAAHEAPMESDAGASDSPRSRSRSR